MHHRLSIACLWQYLMFNVKSRPYNERWVSHFDPWSPIFSKRQRVEIVVSDAALALVTYGLYLAGEAMGWGWMAKTYIVPYLIVNFWLVMITLLQHTHPNLPHYTDAEWDWLRGALATVDRNYGWLLNTLHHHIGMCWMHWMFPNARACMLAFPDSHSSLSRPLGSRYPRGPPLIFDLAALPCPRGNRGCQADPRKVLHEGRPVHLPGAVGGLLAVSIRHRGRQGIGNSVVLKLPRIDIGFKMKTIHYHHASATGSPRPARSRSFRLYSSLSLITPWCSASRSVTCWSCTTPIRTTHARVVDARTTAPLFARISVPFNGRHSAACVAIPLMRGIQILLLLFKL